MRGRESTRTVVRSLGWCIAAGGLLLLSAAAGGAQASTQSFYLAPSAGLALEPTDGLREPLSGGIAACAAVCVRTDQDTAYHEYRLTQAGAVVPVSAHLWIEATEAGAAVPVSSEAECPITVFFHVWDSNDQWKGGWYYCTSLTGFTTVIAPGVYELRLDYRRDLTPIVASSGDWITVSVWTGMLTTSHPAAPSLYLVADASRPSVLVLAGTNEPIPANGTAAVEAPEPSPDAEPMPASSTASASSSAAPSPSTSQAPVTTSGSLPPQEAPDDEESAAPGPGADEKSSPAPWGAALLALALVLLARRRLD
jgi:hypothetical protein